MILVIQIPHINTNRHGCVIIGYSTLKINQVKLNRYLILEYLCDCVSVITNKYTLSVSLQINFNQHMYSNPVTPSLTVHEHTRWTFETLCTYQMFIIITFIPYMNTTTVHTDCVISRYSSCTWMYVKEVTCLKDIVIKKYWAGMYCMHSKIDCVSSVEGSGIQKSFCTDHHDHDYLLLVRTHVWVG